MLRSVSCSFAVLCRVGSNFSAKSSTHRRDKILLHFFSAFLLASTNQTFSGFYDELQIPETSPSRTFMTLFPSLNNVSVVQHKSDDVLRAINYSEPINVNES